MNELVFYTSIEELEKEKWMDFYNHHKRHSIFQSFIMFDFWNSLENYFPFVLFAESPTGECLGFCTGVVVPKGKSKTKNPDRTALIYGGPLLKNDDLSLFDLFINKLEKYLKYKSKYVEFRNLGADLYLKDRFIDHQWKYSPKINYLISLNSEKEVFERFSKSRRRDINKTLSKGVAIDTAKTTENIQATYAFLATVFKRNDKTFVFPIPDLNFLTNLMKLKQSGIVVARFEGRIIAGGVFVFDDTTVYHWFRGGLSREFKDLSPDSVVDWWVMKHGLAHDIPILDFMGAGTKGWDNSIRIYKSRFGGELVENGMYSKASFPLLFRIENKIKRMITPKQSKSKAAEN